jgi:NAD(P)-dependent dehydrogenase (short-subunit alcohol dehydrogenase family)
VVTGGAKGIGWAIARALLANGDRVVVADRDPTAVARLGADPAVSAGRLSAVVADVGSAEGAALAVQTALGAFECLDILCNNAGVRPVAPLLELEPARFDEALRVNVGGIYHCSRAAVPHLQARGGAIVNIASISGLVGYAGGAAYAASKAAAVMLSRVMALELGPLGIRVNCICPGSIQAREAPDGSVEAAPDIPVGRRGRAAEVAQLVLFLVSDAAAFMNGAVLTLDGGITAGRPRRG